MVRIQPTFVLLYARNTLVRTATATATATSDAMAPAKATGIAKKSATRSKKQPPPAQPKELLEEDREHLRHWLSRTDKPFGVKIAALTRKRKRQEEMHVEEGLLVPDLRVLYAVKPRDKWDSLRKYKKFTVGTESIATGQCILVKHDASTEDARMASETQWKAQVLEIRALDSEHVFIRAAWLNRPEDLASGRLLHHGKHELIVTNEMDVIDAMCVNGSVEVVALDDEDDESGTVEDQYFWRQTFDITTKKFSELRHICIDKKPANPDEMIIQCSNTACREWLHVKCIAEQALRDHEKAARQGVHNREASRAKDDSNEEAGATPAVFTLNKNKTKVEVYVKGDPTGPDDVPATNSEIVVIPRVGPAYAQDLVCLVCSVPLADDI